MDNQTPKVDIYKLMSAMSSLDKYFQAPTLPPLERAQKLALSIAPLISCGWDECFLTRTDGKTYRIGGAAGVDERNNIKKFSPHDPQKKHIIWSKCVAGPNYFAEIYNGDVYIFDRRARDAIGEYIGTDFEPETADKLHIACGYNHVAMLRKDGTVKARGGNKYGQLYCDGWVNVKQLAAGIYHTAALRNDGTVIACGNNDCGQCDTRSWTDIVYIACGDYHTVGLKKDGTVVACGHNAFGKCEVSDWTDIITIAAGGDHTVGVRLDGTVVGVGNGDHGQLDVSNWSNIIAVGCGSKYTVALTRDGKAQKCGTRLSYVSSVLGNTEAAIFANTRFFSSAETRAKEYREYAEKVSTQNGKTL